MVSAWWKVEGGGWRVEGGGGRRRRRAATAQGLEEEVSEDDWKRSVNLEHTPEPH